MTTEQQIKAIAELANWKRHLTDFGVWIDEGFTNYEYEEHFPSWKQLMIKNKAWLKEQAKEKLAKASECCHEGVKKHWEMIIAL